MDMIIRAPLGTVQTTFPACAQVHGEGRAILSKENERIDYCLFASLKPKDGEDGLSIASTPFYSGPYFSLHDWGRIGDVTGYPADEVRRRYHNRSRFLMGLALTAVLPGAVYNASYEPTAVSYQLYDTTHDEIKQALPDLSSLASADDAFEYAYAYLLFHFPQDITTMDTVFKRLLLERLSSY